MYTNKVTFGVTSTLIYGTEWDAIMVWIDPAYKTSTCTVDSYVANSEGKGYYKTATLTPSKATNTASNSGYAVKNIYDLAGNCREWTMEAYRTGTRACRGGDYKNTGSNLSSSSRSCASSGNGFDNIGFRVALYL